MDIKTNNPFKEIPQVVFFDLCGTILDSKKLDHEAINYTLEKFNKAPWNITRVKKEPAKSMKENFPNFFNEDANIAYDTYINYLISNINNIPIFNNVYENLRILNILKTKVVIITNRDKNFINALSNNEKFKSIASYIDLIISADEVGITKPSSKIIDYALNRLEQTNINKANIAFVGDALADMNTAISYGCTPILLTMSTSDISKNFILENYSKMYTANSYKELNNCLINTYIERYPKNKNEVMKYYKPKDTNSR